MADLAKRMGELLNGPTLAVLATVTPGGAPWARYVMAWAGDDLVIRLATSLKTRKVAQIKADPRVHLTTGVIDPATARAYVQVEGRASVSTYPALRKACWSPALKAYFQGPEDPDYCVVEIKPERIELWGMSGAPEVWEA